MKMCYVAGPLNSDAVGYINNIRSMNKWASFVQRELGYDVVVPGNDIIYGLVNEGLGYDSYFNNVDLISAVILEILKETASSYIYVSNLVSYSKYDGDAKENIIKRQRLIDFNADTRFNHFTELTVNEFFDYLFQCQ